VAQLVFVWFGIAAISIALYADVLSKTSVASALIVVALVDLMMTLHISKPIMYTEATLPWWHTMNVEENPSLNLTAHGLAREFTAPEMLATYPNNRNLPLKIPILKSYVTLRNRFAEQFAADPTLRQMALGSSRLWFCSEPARSPPNNRSFGEFSERVHELSDPVLVLHSPEQMSALTLRTIQEPKEFSSSVGIKKSGVCSTAAISELLYRPDWLSFKYFAATQGWLLVTDRWAPGWRLIVNGKPEQIFGGDFIFRAVHVQPGKNDIEFRYRPWEFFISLIASWSTLMIVTTLIVCEIVLKSRRS